MISNQYTYFPKWIGNKAIMVYVAALLLVTGIYFRYSIPWYYMRCGIGYSLLFYGHKLTK